MGASEAMMASEAVMAAKPMVPRRTHGRLPSPALSPRWPRAAPPASRRPSPTGAGCLCLDVSFPSCVPSASSRVYALEDAAADNVARPLHGPTRVRIRPPSRCRGVSPLVTILSSSTSTQSAEGAEDARLLQSVAVSPVDEWALRGLYNLCRAHGSLKSLQGTQVQQRSPAIAARLTDHIWTVRESLLCPVLRGQR